jgi:hypothetical protein
MLELEIPKGAPNEFFLACSRIATAPLRKELSIKQIPSPESIAPFAVAFAADVPDGKDSVMHRGVGRVVFLFDTEQQATWASNFRVIAYAKSPIEVDMSEQPDLPNYWWGNLRRTLELNSASYSNEAGTLTRITSTGLGALTVDDPYSEIELRASWSPQELDLSRHFLAWQDLVASMAGYALEAEVQTLRAKRA